MFLNRSRSFTVNVVMANWIPQGMWTRLIGFLKECGNGWLNSTGNVGVADWIKQGMWVWLTGLHRNVAGAVAIHRDCECGWLDFIGNASMAEWIPQGMWEWLTEFHRECGWPAEFHVLSVGNVGMVDWITSSANHPLQKLRSPPLPSGEWNRWSSGCSPSWISHTVQSIKDMNWNSIQLFFSCLFPNARLDHESSCHLYHYGTGFDHRWRFFTPLKETANITLL